MTVKKPKPKQNTTLLHLAYYNNVWELLLGRVIIGLHSYHQPTVLSWLYVSQFPKFCLGKEEKTKSLVPKRRILLGFVCTARTLQMQSMQMYKWSTRPSSKDLYCFKKPIVLSYSFWEGPKKTCPRTFSSLGAVTWAAFQVNTQNTLVWVINLQGSSTAGDNGFRSC